MLKPVTANYAEVRLSGCDADPVAPHPSTGVEFLALPLSHKWKLNKIFGHDENIEHKLLQILWANFNEVVERPEGGAE